MFSGLEKGQMGFMCQFLRSSSSFDGWFLASPNQKEYSQHGRYAAQCFALLRYCTHFKLVLQIDLQPPLSTTFRLGTSFEMC